MGGKSKDTGQLNLTVMPVNWKDLSVLLPCFDMCHDTIYNREYKSAYFLPKEARP